MEERHGVDLGSRYKNRHACTIIVGSIAQDLCERWAGALQKFCDTND